MIVKKVNNSIHGKSKIRTVADLVDYIKNPMVKNANEKLLFSGARGFLTDTHSQQKFEMMSLVNGNSKAQKPILHVIFSWKENEQPTENQCQELMDIFQKETGLTYHQIIWGVHHNTQNIHLHIAVNKIDKDSEKITRINNNLDIEIFHKILAKVEHIQGWESEPNARYTCDEQGNILRANRDKLTATIKQRAIDFEISSGEKSAIRLAQEEVTATIRKAQTWEELHTELEKKNMAYQKKGSGALLIVNGQPVKASSVARDFSMKNMEKRLGIFEEKKQTQAPQNHKQEIDFLTKENIYGKDSRRTSNKQSAESSQIFPQCRMFSLPSCHLVYRRQRRLYRRSRAKTRRRQIEIVLPNFRRAFGKVSDFLRRLSSGTGARALSDCNLNLWFQYQNAKRKHNQEKMIKRLQERVNAQYFAHAEKEKHSYKFTEWLKMNDFPKELNTWRHERNDAYFVNNITKERIKTPQDMEKISLVLAEKGWTKIFLEGDDFFKIQAVKTFMNTPFTITNPELQAFIQKEKEELLLDYKNELDNFRYYHNAVNADKYRVTCIKMKANGENQAFLLDKQYKVNGFTPAELEKRLPEMKKIQSKGNNIYLTPLSDHKYHILIDDLSKDKLRAFLDDGFKPAVVLESSPENFQAILTIPKLDATFDKEIGNRISDRLNKKYGDENLSGCVHPHRVPGFLNQKPKHKREDGTYPHVKLISHEAQECEKTIRLSKQILDEHQVAAKKREKRLSPSNWTPSTSTQTAYFLHLENIKKHLDITDKSRVDSMIALRLRATGHSEGEIYQTILECAPTWREPNERKSWEDYAKRTARYAFSFAGDKQLEQNEKYVNHWHKLEGLDNKVKFKP